MKYRYMFLKTKSIITILLIITIINGCSSRDEEDLGYIERVDPPTTFIENDKESWVAEFNIVFTEVPEGLEIKYKILDAEFRQQFDDDNSDHTSENNNIVKVSYIFKRVKLTEDEFNDIGKDKFDNSTHQIHTKCSVFWETFQHKFLVEIHVPYHEYYIEPVDLNLDNN